MKIKKGDKVIVIAGKDKGKTGKIVKTLARDNRVVVEGINIAKRHQRARKQGEKGQILETAMPIHASNVQFIDPKDNKPTRVGIKIEGGKKIRITKRSGSTI